MERGSRKNWDRVKYNQNIKVFCLFLRKPSIYHLGVIQPQARFCKMELMLSFSIYYGYRINSFRELICV